MKLKDLREKRAQLITDLRAIEARGSEAGGLTEAQTADADRLTAELRSTESAIDRRELVDAAERRMQGEPVDGSGGDAGFDRLAAQVSLLDAINAGMGDTSTAAGRAREVSQELERRSGRKPEGIFWPMGAARAPEQRVFTTANPGGGPGSNLIQTDVAGTVIDRLRQRSITRALGATILTGLIGNLALPRMKASATGAWVAENAAITASDPQVDQVTLSPKHAGAIVEVSRQMLQQSSMDVARLFEMDMAQVLATTLDTAAIKGGGTNEPVGILATSGIGSVALGTDGAAPTWDSIVALIAAIDTANALGGSLAFAGNAKTTSKLRRTLKTSADTASNFIMTDPNTLAGYPKASSQNVPANLTKGSGSNLSALIFGDWSQLMIGFWSELDVLVNPYESTAYSKGNVQVRAMLTCDVKLRQVLAFAAITDMVTT